jgi:hypothetical protein
MDNTDLSIDRMRAADSSGMAVAHAGVVVAVRRVLVAETLLRPRITTTRLPKCG